MGGISVRLAIWAMVGVDDVSGYTVTYLTVLELIDRRIKREWMETVGMRALS